MDNNQDYQINKSDLIEQKKKMNKIPIGTVTKNFFDIEDYEDQDYKQSDSPSKLLQDKKKNSQQEKKQFHITHSPRKKKGAVVLQPMKNANPKKIDLPDFNGNQNEESLQVQNPEKKKPDEIKKQTKPNNKLNFHLSSSDQEPQRIEQQKKQQKNKKNSRQNQQALQEEQNSGPNIDQNQQVHSQQQNQSQRQQRQQTQNMRSLSLKNSRCFILRRHKQWFSKLWPQFNLHLQSNNQYQFSGKITGNNAATTTIISSTMEDFNQNGAQYLGKVKSNFIGNLINIYGPGYNPSDYKNKNLPLRNVLATVQYQTNFFGSTRPRNFKVFLLKPGAQYYNLQGPTKGQDQLPLNQLYQNPKNKDKILVMINRKPEWNEKIKGFMLNFGGRVKKPSIKNFILEDEQNPQNARLIFGKLDDDQFRLDIGDPLTPFIGFGIALSTFGGKIGCE